MPMDVASLQFLVLEHPGFTQWSYGGFSFGGPCDVEAFRCALREPQADFPLFHSFVVPFRRGVWTEWGWRVQPAPVELEVYDRTALAQAPADMEAWLHEEMTERVANIRDLRTNYPVRFLLFLFPGERQMFVFLFHHCAVDGGGFYNFFGAVLQSYHRLATGRDPEWAGVAGIHSQTGAAQIVTPLPLGRVLREMFAEFRKYPPWRIGQFANPPAAASGRKVVRLLVEDRAVQRALRDRARREGGSMTDIFVAAAKRALDDFNAARGGGGGGEIMFFALPVNQRLRRPRAETAAQSNPLGAVTIMSNADDRRDPAALLRWVISERKRKLTGGYDYWLTWLGRKSIAASAILPLGPRSRALRALMGFRVTLAVTNLGVVWPRIENGRPTGETAIRQVGRMELLDVHNNTAQPKTNGGALVLRTFLDRLYLVFQFGRHQIGDADAEEYGRLVLDHAQRYL